MYLIFSGFIVYIRFINSNSNIIIIYIYYLIKFHIFRVKIHYFNIILNRIVLKIVRGLFWKHYFLIFIQGKIHENNINKIYLRLAIYFRIILFKIISYN